MKNVDVITVFVCYFAFSIAYLTDHLTRVEYLLAMLFTLVLYVLILLCRILSTLKSIYIILHHEKDNVQ